MIISLNAPREKWIALKEHRNTELSYISSHRLAGWKKQRKKLRNKRSPPFLIVCLSTERCSTIRSHFITLKGLYSAYETRITSFWEVLSNSICFQTQAGNNSFIQVLCWTRTFLFALKPVVSLRRRKITVGVQQVGCIFHWPGGGTSPLSIFQGPL